MVSYDLNLRPSIWAAAGGLDRAIEINRELAASVDVMIDFLSLVRPPDFRTAAAVTVEEVRDLALQADIAERLGTTQSAISRAEQRGDMLYSTLLAYLRAAGAQDATLTVTIGGRRVEVSLDEAANA